MSKGLRLAHTFRDEELLRKALRHRSAGAPHNERFEFLGDALLNAIIAQELFKRFPKADEGPLTRARAELVRESALAGVAQTMDLAGHLVLGPGEMKSGGHRRASIQADAVEAIIAAVFLDSDMATVHAFVLHYWEPLLQALPPIAKIVKDPKTRLQELLQGRGHEVPTYELAGETGPDHAREFSVRCIISQFNIETQGEASSRRAAEQIAADMALTRLLERL